MAYVKDEISSKELHNRKCFQEKSLDHIHDVTYRGDAPQAYQELIKVYPQCKFQTEIMLGNW